MIGHLSNDVIQVISRIHVDCLRALLKQGEWHTQRSHARYKIIRELLKNISADFRYILFVHNVSTYGSIRHTHGSIRQVFPHVQVLSASR